MFLFCRLWSHFVHFAELALSVLQSQGQVDLVLCRSATPHARIWLADVAQRAEELGQLSRVFQNMARQVYAREQRLKRQLQELRIEIDEARKAC
jgi:hypothetical protein